MDVTIGADDATSGPTTTWDRGACGRRRARHDRRRRRRRPRRQCHLAVGSITASGLMPVGGRRGGASADRCGKRQIRMRRPQDRAGRVFTSRRSQMTADACVDRRAAGRTWDWRGMSDRRGRRQVDAERRARPRSCRRRRDVHPETRRKIRESHRGASIRPRRRTHERAATRSTNPREVLAGPSDARDRARAVCTRASSGVSVSADESPSTAADASTSPT